MERITHSLELPVIGGELVAQISITDRRGVYTDWALEFVVPGPDFRYNSAFATITSKDFGSFVAVLQDAVVQMQSLSLVKRTDTFTKCIWRSTNNGSIPFRSRNTPRLEIEARERGVWLVFWFNSGTFEFRRQMDVGQVHCMIQQLATVEARAQDMVGTLQCLNAAAIAAAEMRALEEETRQRSERTLRRQRQEQAHRDRMEQLRKRHEEALQAIRKRSSQCVMCGKPLGFFRMAAGADRHSGCKSFID